MSCNYVKIKLWGARKFRHLPFYPPNASVFQKHDPPTSSIPCLHYKKMKEQEEREQNGEVTPNVSPVKDGEEGEAQEITEEPDSTAPEGACDESNLDTMDNQPEGKDSQGGEMAQGALGQVKAKVEVCKDESVGKTLKCRWCSCTQRLVSLNGTMVLSFPFLPYE